MNSIGTTIVRNRRWVIGLLALLVVVLALFGLVGKAGATCSAPTIWDPVLKRCVSPPVKGPYEPIVHGYCDYGRHPRRLWSDNEDGHPFERPFCDGIGADEYKDPLDTPENDGLYCDEVPGCWAYGLTLPGHH